jgi:23S rRNA (pseudouridine1915-N3)-methyltransferase
MRLHLLAIGRLRAGPQRELFAQYARRLPWPLNLREMEARRASGRRRDHEAALLLEATPKGAVLIALDERGATWSSEAFARKIGAWRDDGLADLAFAIGGADGHGQALLARADVTLSLGAMTWPHLLARVMLAEQLYRASAILAGHPYHRA